MSNGKVITFGSNSNGQLGCSLSLNRKGPTILKIPRLKYPIISVSAGSNHTALVSKDGKLYTFGSYLVNINYFIIIVLYNSFNIFNTVLRKVNLVAIVVVIMYH